MKAFISLAVAEKHMLNSAIIGVLSEMYKEESSFQNCLAIFLLESAVVHIYLLRWTIVSHSDEKKQGCMESIKGDQFSARTSGMLGSSLCQ